MNYEETESDSFANTSKEGTRKPDKKLIVCLQRVHSNHNAGIEVSPRSGMDSDLGGKHGSSYC